MKEASYWLVALALATSAGCDSGSSLLDRESVQLGHLIFEVPATWHRTDSGYRGVISAEWTPDDNDRHESVVVMRTSLSPAVAKAGGAIFERLLVDAQRSLAKARTSTVSPVMTARGLQGARVDVDFTRPESAAKFRRTHVVLVEGEGDGAALVHVLYTAQRPDPARVALNGVLDTIRREELKP